MKGFNKIKSGTVVDKIVEEITEAITEKRLKPGDKLPSETEMASTFGVSRTSVRESMKILSALGIIEIKRGNGTFITTDIKPSSFENLIYAVMLEQSTKQEVLELRKIFEVDILNLAIQKATEEDINYLEEILDEFEENFKNENYNEAAELDHKFHIALVKLSKNKLFEKLVLAVYEFFFKSIERTIISYEIREQKAMRVHRKMVEVIKKRDESQVEELVEYSLEGWKNYI